MNIEKSLSRATKVLAAAVLAFLIAEEFGGWGGRFLLISHYMMLAGVLLFATRAPRMSWSFALVPLALVVFASRIKHKLLAYPVYFWDLKFLVGQDQWDVLKHYAGTLGAWSLVGAHVVVLCGIVVLFRAERRRISFESRVRRSRALVLAGLGAALSFGAWHWLLFEARTWVHPDLMGFRHPYAIFWVSSQAGRVELVPAPRPGARELQREATAVRSRPVDSSKQRPDLILILQESAMDPRLLSTAWSDEPRWDPMVRAGALHGPLHVHVFGGGTWCSEFTSLVGLPTPALGVMGGYATYILEGRVQHSLVSHLKDLGYRTESLYPGPGDFVNGGPFHRSLGFDAFLDFTNRSGFQGSYWNLTDQEVFETALGRIERHRRTHPEQPLFLWVKTIRNHGPHGLDCAGRDFAAVDPLLEKAGLPPEENCALRDYLDRYDQALAGYGYLKAELKQRFPEREFEILQFGDHQPTTTETLTTSEGKPLLSLEERHITYHASERVGPGPGHLVPVSPRVAALRQSTLDLAHLPAFWLESLGLPLSPLMEQQLEAALVCKGAYPQEASSVGGTPECLQAISEHHGRLQASGALGL